MKVCVVSDPSAPVVGHVGDALVEHGAELVTLDRTALPDTVPDADLLLLLGSHLTAHDPENGTVQPESALLRGTLAAGVPALGICYGAQLMARALGGSSRRGDVAEIGWKDVDSLDETLCPPGPWAQMHNDVFTAPPSSTLLGSSAAGHQAFLDTAHGAPALAWQFHPEVTTAEMVRWLDDDAEFHASIGVDLDAEKQRTADLASDARDRAHALVASALDVLLPGPSDL